MLLILHGNTDPNGTSNLVDVDRACVMEGTRVTFEDPYFNPSTKLSVRIGVEPTIDAGGPMRETLRLLMAEIGSSGIFCGPETARLLNLDVNGKDF